MSPRIAPALRIVAIGAVLVICVGAGLYVTALGSAALYQLMHHQRPHDLALDLTWRYWQAYADQPLERRRLTLAILLPAGLCFVALPIGVAVSLQPRRPLHGAARFARRAEIRAAGLLDGRGILLGRYRGGYLTLPGQLSVLLSAPTRGGKGVGIVVPNLLCWPDSVVVLDVKSENWQLTAGFRASHGHPVFCWSPFAGDGRSHRWNPLDAVRAGTRFVVPDLLGIAQSLYPTELRSSGSDTFFAEQARNLFLGLGLLVLESPELPHTIGEILRQSGGQGRPITEHLQATIAARDAVGRPLSAACRDALSRFLGTSENTLASILATLNAPLTLFADPFVDAATSGSDFALADLRRRRMSVYVCIPPNRLADAGVLLNLFFAQLIHLNTDVLPEHDRSLQHQCLLMLDELTSMGRIAVLSKAIGYLAGYGLRVVSVIQAVSQLEATYGDREARTFVTNHGAQILFAPREQRDANEYSEMLGTYTQREESQGRSSGRGGSTSSRNTSAQRRALLLPQEFKELGRDREVIAVENCKPILADKIRFYDDPTFASRVLPPPVVPVLTISSRRAVGPRARPAEAGEVPRLADVVLDASGLPAVGADAPPDEVEAFVDAFFAQLLVTPETGAAVREQAATTRPPPASHDKELTP